MSIDYSIDPDQIIRKREDGKAKIIITLAAGRTESLECWPDDFSDDSKNAKKVWRYAQSGEDMPTDILPYTPPPPPDPKDIARRELVASDENFIRVAEDILTVLIAKGIMTEGDLPAAAKTKINNRKGWREIIES